MERRCHAGNASAVFAAGQDAKRPTACPRSNGATLDQWDAERLGEAIGYLPQSVELLEGTVAENIARFVPDADSQTIIAAAREAGVHELIVQMPQGYDTPVGRDGAELSAGQRQRIGLARALFGNPAFLVLDEPNANLDRMGDEALASALNGMKKRGQAVVLISHRVQAMGVADTLLYVDRGVQRAFGPQAEVMKMFRQAGQAAAEAGTKPPEGRAPAQQQQQQQQAPAPQPSGPQKPTPSPQPAGPAGSAAPQQRAAPLPPVPAQKVSTRRRPPALSALAACG